MGASSFQVLELLLFVFLSKKTWASFDKLFKKTKINYEGTRISF